MLLSIWQVVVLFHTIVNLFVNFLFKRSKKKASPIKQIDTVLSFTWKQIGFSFTFSSLQFAIGLLLCTVLVPVCQARCFHSLRFGNLHLNPKSIVSLRCHGRQTEEYHLQLPSGLSVNATPVPFFQLSSFTHRCDRLCGPSVTGVRLFSFKQLSIFSSTWH